MNKFDDPYMYQSAISFLYYLHADIMPDAEFAGSEGHEHDAASIRTFVNDPTVDYHAIQHTLHELKII